VADDTLNLETAEDRAMRVALALMARQVTGLTAQIVLLNHEISTQNTRATNQEARDAAAKTGRDAAQADRDRAAALRRDRPVTSAREDQIGQQQVANRDLGESLKSGDYLAQQKELNKLAAERAALEREAVQQQRVARYGAVGGAVANAAHRAADSPIGGVAGALAREFGAVLSPLTRLASYLDSVTSGFGLFGTAIRVFVSAVAPILLPVMVVLSAALISLSEVIWRELQPAL
jgi:hypothetical protein